MPGDMTIKSSLLGEILEKLASLRMNITIRLDDDREEGDPVGSAYILIFIDFAGICYLTAEVRRWGFWESVV